MSSQAREILFAKAKTYYSNEALNPRPKRGRPPKQVAKVELEPQVTMDIYTQVPAALPPFPLYSRYRQRVVGHLLRQIRDRRAPLGLICAAALACASTKNSKPFRSAWSRCAIFPAAWRGPKRCSALKKAKGHSIHFCGPRLRKPRRSR